MAIYYCNSKDKNVSINIELKKTGDLEKIYYIPGMIQCSDNDFRCTDDKNCIVRKMIAKNRE